MYEEYYGLKARPFALAPDPDFYFESVTHKKALSYLGYGLSQGEGFVVVTGEIGSGKSTLVAHLMKKIDPARLTAAQIVTTSLEDKDLLSVVANAFGIDLPSGDKPRALGAIEAFLHDEAREGRRCLLIVDEAQNLSIGALEELRMLSNFQLGAHPLLQTLLLGQPEFRQKIEAQSLEQLRQRVIASHHLTPMGEDEVEEYVLHRLRVVGWEGRPEFTDDVFPALYQASEGVPRRINQICQRLLLAASVEETDTIDLDMFDRVLDEMESEGHSAVEDHAERQEKPVHAPTKVEKAAAAEASSVRGANTQDVLHQLAERLASLTAAPAENGAGRDHEAREAIARIEAKLEQLGAEADPDAARAIATLEARCAALEEANDRLSERLTEQEQTLRHTLTMLIEWIEGGEDSRKIA
ncbi:MAG: general secretion pathway protein [Sphingomonadales bacterium CG12_big_fil_rev_8_21_14_0_65_65_10]|uniref:XrtA/PEP-CTERM system-associated ATPase n=1 Tax=Blastomonas marina TaxID=1867408 RepID=UPI000CC91A26|nr:XrtA/PEP-CTERM system-associated ATPase [Blastomonas marina]PIW55134.1 MAG: general secretion pathway protein [Sphingomonadales bacterium CG12_big_fil_rev_8_21_14_0_65_65_10]WPZ04980.1 XrtA/PEP-CTERM system-associated ATPase [Blastomonas marina]